LIKTFQAHTDSINRIKLLPNKEAYVATCSDDHTVKIWKISNKNLTSIQTFTDHSASVRDFEYVNEDTMVSGDSNGNINIWSISVGFTNRTFNTGLGAQVFSLKLLSNGFYLACGLNYGDILIYNLNDDTLVNILKGHGSSVFDLEQINTDLLVSSSFDKFVFVWNLTTLTTKFRFKYHTQQATRLKFIPPDILSSGSYDTTIKLWNITSGNEIETLVNHTGMILYSIDLFDDRTLVSGSYDQTIKLWDLNTGELKSSIESGVEIQALIVLNSIGTN